MVRQIRIAKANHFTTNEKKKKKRRSFTAEEDKRQSMSKLKQGSEGKLLFAKTYDDANHLYMSQQESKV